MSKIYFTFIILQCQWAQIGNQTYCRMHTLHIKTNELHVKRTQPMERSQISIIELCWLTTVSKQITDSSNHRGWDKYFGKFSLQLQLFSVTLIRSTRTAWLLAASGKVNMNMSPAQWLIGIRLEGCSVCVQRSSVQPLVSSEPTGTHVSRSLGCCE